MWNYKTFGIPDSEFERTDGVPITKEEIRTIQISKARLNPGNTIYDVGCGSGSVSVEAAIQIESGMVYAIDFDSNAIKITRKNLEKFNISNVTVICGNAKEKIAELPKADAIFIGGTGGDTGEIIKICGEKLNPGGRIVIGTILVETLYCTIRALEEAKFTDIDITQVSISKSRKTSTGTMMLARNPVTVVSAKVA